VAPRAGLYCNVRRLLGIRGLRWPADASSCCPVQHWRRASAQCKMVGSAVTLSVHLSSVRYRKGIRSMSTLTSRRASAGVVAVGALLLTLLAVAPETEARTIWACAKQIGGAVHIVTVETTCKRREVKLSWTGATGAKGERGERGATGANGTNGTNGTNGAPGAAGVTGATGATGAGQVTGATGPTGATGNTGARGVTGESGATGSTGPTGPTAVTRVTGTSETSGPAAAAGEVVGPVTASCSGSTTLVGGGVEVTNSGGERGATMDSFPSVAGLGGTWTANGVAVVAGTGTDSFTVTAYALCGS
jgi:hypothetical protein